VAYMRSLNFAKLSSNLLVGIRGWRPIFCKGLQSSATKKLVITFRA
jgi:hypothetical protein